MTLFTTGWGALYLVVLVALMAPALFFKERRWLAFAMILLWGLDRAAVAFLEPAVALFFLAFAYTMMAFAVLLTHGNVSSRVMSVSLLTISVAFIVGGFGMIDWDAAGSVQEFFGLIAMIGIISGRGGGATHGIPYGRAAHPGPIGHRGTPARRQAHK